MDRAEIGLRIREARELAGVTQVALAESIGVDRSAVSRLEAGERGLDVTEMLAVATALHRPLSFFVVQREPTVVSRRRDAVAADSFGAHETTARLDAELHQMAVDVASLLERGACADLSPQLGARVPRSHHEAEQFARSVRRRIGLDDEPILNLLQVCGELGLTVLAVALGSGGPDGACTTVERGERSRGIAVVNADAQPGRQRMTLAHELGHWLTGGAYDVQAGPEAERLLNSFAIHFLAPRSGVVRSWGAAAESPTRDRAIIIAARFGLSWSAALGQLSNLDLISAEERERWEPEAPGRSDRMRLGLSLPDPLRDGDLSPDLGVAVLSAYEQGLVSAERSVEILRGSLARSELPARQPDLEGLRRALADDSW